MIETDARRSSNSLRLPAEAVEIQVEETDAQNVIESEDVDEKTMEEAWRMTHTLRHKKHKKLPGLDTSRRIQTRKFKS